MTSYHSQLKMADSEKEEAANLQMEFEWVLHEEVHAVLTQLHTILLVKHGQCVHSGQYCTIYSCKYNSVVKKDSLECVRRFPVPLCGNDGPQKQDKFVLTAPPEQLKCVVTLTGDSITHADINFKVQRQQNVIHRTTIQNDSPWKLQQVQDAGNHLQQALLYIENVDKDYMFKSSEEVLHVLSSILGCLQRGRGSLVVPRKRTIDDLMKSRNMKSLAPSLPEDLAISFYIQSHKLIFAVYQLSNVHGTMKFDSHQAECSIPWLNEVLVLFTVALQLCQQLKDKVMPYTIFYDPAVGPTFSVLQFVSFHDLIYGLIIPSAGVY